MMSTKQTCQAVDYIFTQDRAWSISS